MTQDLVAAAVERVARAILERRIMPDFREVKDGHWTVDHDKELALAAIAALTEVKL